MDTPTFYTDYSRGWFGILLFRPRGFGNSSEEAEKSEETGSNLKLESWSVSRALSASSPIRGIHGEEKP